MTSAPWFPGSSGEDTPVETLAALRRTDPTGLTHHLGDRAFLLPGLAPAPGARVGAAVAHMLVLGATGNVSDLSWIDEFEPAAVLLAWSGGMEGARAAADVLTGASEPGGRLTDTIARRYEDHPSAGHFGETEATEYVEDVFVGYRHFETFAPEDVLFPFGYGLGYTQVELREATVTVSGEQASVQVTAVPVASRSSTCG